MTLLLLTTTISRKCSESFLAKCLFSYFQINNPLVLQNVEIDEDKDHALPMGSHNTVGSPSHSGRHGEHCRHTHTQTHTSTYSYNTNTQTHTHSYNTNMYTCRDTDRHPHAHIHRHKKTQIMTQKLINTQRYTPYTLMVNIDKKNFFKKSLNDNMVPKISPFQTL